MDTPKIRPSTLPMWQQCPCLVPTTGNAYTTAGTARHAALAAVLGGNDNALAALPDDQQREAVQWAAEYIRLKAPMADYPLEVETKGAFISEGWDTIEGTPDVCCGPADIFDLKSRPRDYSAQMAAYALMQFERFPGAELVRCHLLYAETKTVEVLEFDHAKASALVESIIASVKTAERTPRACDYCSWCAIQTTCPELVEAAQFVASCREDWDLETFHATDIAKPVEMAKALKLARRLADWCEGIERAAKEMAVKQGVTLPGFTIREMRGRREVTSVTGAFGVVGLPQADFLTACKVGFTDLVAVYAGVHGMKKAPAERDLEAKLGDLCKRKPSSIQLVAERKGKE